ncbi:hypothetical protein HERIO_262 [Hepatospora eriocheir]|uniref:Uncharacterized protein n=1 Tax=Hepatospora eriocheir TaxID=1081669 RepID=A0A1X0QDX9_9MICR|nr:hypothetical protein HERIO_262 [Hepatospora eriocheir]
MEIKTKVVREVLKQFYFIVLFDLKVIKNSFQYIYELFNEGGCIDLNIIVHCPIFLCMVFCIIIGLIASHYYVKDIAVHINQGFFINEFLVILFYVFNSFEKKIESEEMQNLKPLVDNFINKEISYINADSDLDLKITFVNTLLCEKFEKNNKGCLKETYLFCVELLIYMIISNFSNGLISTEKTLILFILIIMSLKTCLKAFLDNDETIIVYLKMSECNIFYLITCVIIFILSLFVKLVRDVLVNVILSVFYSIILSLLISFIYYEKYEFYSRLKLLLLDEDVLIRNVNFIISDKKFEIEFIFMGCFILYLITIFLTWRLFWKKKIIV